MVETMNGYEEQEDDERAKKIAELNDEFRLNPHLGEFRINVGVLAKGKEIVCQAVALTRTFSEFNEANNPHGERDYGRFELQGDTYLWKIDYYDNEMLFHSPDPTDPNVTVRVLTLMLKEEY